MSTINKTWVFKVIIVITCLLCTASSISFAQVKSTVDSLSYETQRQKVNNLLEQRRQKFGEFDQSVLKKSGVFGIFKTKRDMQQSIDILKAVVINDNHIFLETQKLLSLKDFEKAHYQKLADEYDTQSSAYMRTITKLQTENEKLRGQVDSLDEEEHQGNVWLYLCLIVIVGLASYVVYLHRRNSLSKN
ncbi:hypothetical protein M8998_15640 [Sphingobacterium sp. lm-10]|uniref:hypothetical protein n=1 Tax=Sphingobacterium sp. lm-10 TaxID=2944904 RepID=UPI0020208530|nr:hypothetical protein [Sphingobacterium sp. lm-10]MCL7989384.1 hypothetical protein [Sphingobacterium sp. lm-10]